MDLNDHRRPGGESRTAAQMAGRPSTTLTLAADAATQPHRRQCRIKACRETIPYALGFSPDWTCWRHHRLVVPPLEVVGRG